MENNVYYVYQLIDPRINLPFYIGKGKMNRCFEHFNETIDNTENINKFHRIYEIKKSGFDIPVVKIIENIDEVAAYDIEEFMILFYGREGIEEYGILTNICLASRPPSHKGKSKSFEHRRKISEAQKGKKLSDEHLKNLQIAAKKTGLSRRGSKHTPDAIQKMRNAKIGKQFSEQHRKNLSKANKRLTGEKNGFYGKKHSEISKEKMSKSLKGKVRSDEFKENLSNYWKGKPKGPMSEETKEKLRLRAKERAQKRKEQ